MALYARMQTAKNQRDVAAFTACYHDDWEFLFHSTGKTMRRVDDTEQAMLERWETFVEEAERCLYENDDILVTHALVSFPNGTRDAVMMVHRKKDGLIWRTETGSTPLPTD